MSQQEAAGAAQARPAPEHESTRNYRQLTRDDYAAEILTVHYMTAYDGLAGQMESRMAADVTFGRSAEFVEAFNRVMICVMRLKNGMMVVGSACRAYTTPDDQEIARAASYNAAFAQIPPMMQYYAAERRRYDYRPVGSRVMDGNGMLKPLTLD